MTPEGANATHKFCRKCATWKPRSEFWARSASPDGLQARCKPCQVLLRRMWERATAEYARRVEARLKPPAKPTIVQVAKRCGECDRLLMSYRFTAERDRCDQCVTSEVAA